MINELDERFTNCSPEINHLLHACLDVNVLLPALVGKRKDLRKTPVNRNKFATLGANEFHQIVGFVGRLPHVAALNLSLCEESSSTIFSHLKNFLIEMIWGSGFVEHFPKFFEVIEVDKKPVAIQLNSDDYVLDFQVASVTEFRLPDLFDVTLNSNVTHTVKFKEDQFIRCLYTDSQVYSQARSFVSCLI